jgi:hypothetical protein
MLGLDAAALGCATAAGWCTGDPVIGCAVTAAALAVLSFRIGLHFD